VGCRGKALPGLGRAQRPPAPSAAGKKGFQRGGTLPLEARWSALPTADGKIKDFDAAPFSPFGAVQGAKGGHSPTSESKSVICRAYPRRKAGRATAALPGLGRAQRNPGSLEPGILR